MKYLYIIAILALTSCTIENRDTNIKPDSTQKDIGDIILNGGSDNAKIQVYKARLKANSRDTKSLIALGKILTKQSKYKSAEKIFSRAYDLDGDNLDIVIHYIKTLLKNTKNNLAVEIINKYHLNNDLFSPEFFLLAGISSVVVGSLDVANNIYDLGIDKYPDDLELKHHKVFALLLLNQLDLSINYAKNILEENYHQKIKIRQILIIANILKGDIKEAKKIALVDVDVNQVDKIINSYDKLTKLNLENRNKQLLKFVDFLTNYI
jgi:tetratricopeptide (TPR) repeat protein